MSNAPQKIVQIVEEEKETVISQEQKKELDQFAFMYNVKIDYPSAQHFKKDWRDYQKMEHFKSAAGKNILGKVINLIRLIVSRENFPISKDYGGTMNKFLLDEFKGKEVPSFVERVCECFNFFVYKKLFSLRNTCSKKFIFNKMNALLKLTDGMNDDQKKEFDMYIEQEEFDENIWSSRNIGESEREHLIKKYFVLCITKAFQIKGLPAENKDVSDKLATINMDTEVWSLRNNFMYSFLQHNEIMNVEYDQEANTQTIETYVVQFTPKPEIKINEYGLVCIMIPDKNKKIHCLQMYVPNYWEGNMGGIDPKTNQLARLSQDNLYHYFSEIKPFLLKGSQFHHGCFWPTQLLGSRETLICGKPQTSKDKYTAFYFDHLVRDYELFYVSEVDWQTQYPDCYTIQLRKDAWNQIMQNSRELFLQAQSKRNAQYQKQQEQWRLQKEKKAEKAMKEIDERTQRIREAAKAIMTMIKIPEEKAIEMAKKQLENADEEKKKKRDAKAAEKGKIKTDEVSLYSSVVVSLNSSFVADDAPVLEEKQEEAPALEEKQEEAPAAEKKE